MRILVPTDGSAHAQLALAEAAELAAALGGTVTLLTVSAGVRLEPSSILATPSLPPDHHRGQTDYLDPPPDEAWAILQAGASVFLHKGLEPQLVHREGEPAEVILEEARAVGAKLIVMGARGRSAIARLLLGSVADRVIHHAPCSVLVTRGEPFQLR